MFLTTTWKDFEVLDTGDGEKLERWGDVILRRPDPQTIWPEGGPCPVAAGQGLVPPLGQGRRRALGVLLPACRRSGSSPMRRCAFTCGPRVSSIRGFSRSRRSTGTGWRTKSAAQGGRKDLRVCSTSSPTPAAPPWPARRRGRMSDPRRRRQGHGPAGRRENRPALPACRRPADPLDCGATAQRFVQREIRRGQPLRRRPHGPAHLRPRPLRERCGSWKTSFYGLIDTCAQVLSPEPLFFLVNSYTTGFQASVLSNNH